ncbi:conserved hypothetical protein [Gloeothece citriformis PCC 7424]|uniref:Transposase n=1 Tax=Gloeothece citriformis (strain PCC 7424) TaxID=65393 RepID=B7KCP7_GLOC7|nr:transposase [Gloeothece citriformis]ACK71598.1 conserved hypothetical protein [Gloeothece citriformis PCC 7424]
MSPRKLTNDNKKEILKLYRETGETTSTLAERYEVSSSTISRFLKTHLTESEYEDLIQQKRLARTPKGALQLELEKMNKSNQGNLFTTPPDESEVEPEPELKVEETPEEEQEEEEEVKAVEPQEELKPVEEVKVIQKPVSKLIRFPSQEQPEVSQKTPVVKEVTYPSSPPEPEPEQFEEEEDEEDISRVDVAAYAMLDDEDLLYFDEEEEDEEDEEDWEDEIDISYPNSFPKTAQLQILPIASAAFPKTCYLVIDRAAELITRPLKEFAELGKIPAEEVQQKTLPVFDNHRVARRFSKRRERVIKIPDGRMIQKTCSHLEAKGITRLLLDGQIYSL